MNFSLSIFLSLSFVYIILVLIANILLFEYNRYKKRKFDKYVTNCLSHGMTCGNCYSHIKDLQPISYAIKSDNKMNATYECEHCNHMTSVLYLSDGHSYIHLSIWKREATI